MSSNFVKRYYAIGWDWYLETDECESWVSQPVKEHIEALEAENEKLRELISSYWKRVHLHITSNVERDYLSELRELGVDV